MNTHTYYRPTEYEELLLAAGWLTLADLDIDYQRYERNTDELVMDYAYWTQSKRDLDALKAQHRHDFPDTRPMTTFNSHQSNLLLDKIYRLELALGHYE